MAKRYVLLYKAHAGMMCYLNFLNPCLIKMVIYRTGVVKVWKNRQGKRGEKSGKIYRMRGGAERVKERRHCAEGNKIARGFKCACATGGSIGNRSKEK